MASSIKVQYKNYMNIVSWTQVENATEYIVLRETDKNGNISTDTLGVVAEYTYHKFYDTKIQPNTTYKYIIRAKQKDGKYSVALYSDPITTPNFTEPIIHSEDWFENDMHPQAQYKNNSIVVSWNPPKESLHAVRIFIYRADGPQVAPTGSVVAMVNASDTTYTDTDIEAGKTYTYFIRAQDMYQKLTGFYGTYPVTVPLDFDPSKTPNNPDDNGGNNPKPDNNKKKTNEGPTIKVNWKVIGLVVLGIIIFHMLKGGK